MSGNVHSNVREVKGLVVGYVDPEGEGVKAKPDANRVDNAIGAMQSLGVNKDMALAAIRGARDDKRISPDVATALIRAASLGLDEAKEKPVDGMRQAAREAAAPQSWLSDLIDMLKEAFSGGLASTKWKDGVDGAQLDKADEMGRNAAVDKDMSRDIKKEGGPEKYMEKQLANIKMDPEVKQKLITEFANGYNFQINGHY